MKDKNMMARRNRAAKKYGQFCKVEKLEFSQYEVGFRLGDLRDGVEIGDVPEAMQNEIATHEVFVYRSK